MPCYSTVRGTSFMDADSLGKAIGESGGSVRTSSDLTVVGVVGGREIVFNRASVDVPFSVRMSMGSQSELQRSVDPVRMPYSKHQVVKWGKERGYKATVQTDGKILLRKGW